jgi:hypothetical protein
MRSCPACTATGLAANAKSCPDCGYALPAPNTREGFSERAERALEARKRFVSEAPDSWSLSSQQWFNVCKFLPLVAARCKRPLMPVSDANPLAKHAQLGPLLRGFQLPKPIDYEARREREAIQGEGK